MQIYYTDMISLQFFASFVKHVTRCYLAVLHFDLNFSGIMLLTTRADKQIYEHITQHVLGK